MPSLRVQASLNFRMCEKKGVFCLFTCVAKILRSRSNKMMTTVVKVILIITRTARFQVTPCNRKRYCVKSAKLIRVPR